jgi:hypothetical protein
MEIVKVGKYTNWILKNFLKYIKGLDNWINHNLKGKKNSGLDDDGPYSRFCFCSLSLFQIA